MSSIPPGIRFIAERSTLLLVPVLLTYSALAIIAFWPSGLHGLESWTRRLWITLLLQPAIIVIRIKHADYVLRREAKALGAELPPQYQHKEFAGLDIIRMLLAHMQTAYLGDPILILSQGCQGATTFIINALFQRSIFTIEPEHIKNILATQFNNFEKGSSLFVALQSLLGIGVFNSDGDIWKFHRTTARPFFNKDRIVDFENFERHVQLALDSAQSRIDEGIALDMQVKIFLLVHTPYLLHQYLFPGSRCQVHYGLCYSVSFRSGYLLAICGASLPPQPSSGTQKTAAFLGNFHKRGC
jgi:hypothetical protein